MSLIAVEHQEPVVQEVFGELQRAAGPEERRRLFDVAQPYAQALAVAEHGPHPVGHEAALDRIASSTPCRRNQSIMYEMNGRPASGTTGFGTDDVSGRSRVPSPPARISACNLHRPIPS